MTIKTFIYPTVGSNKAKNLSAVSNIASDINTALGKYCKDEGIHDPQGIRLPGLNDVLKAVKAFKEELAGTKNELALRGGIDGSGHLVLGVTGIVPRKGKPAKIDEEIVIRKDFAKAIAQIKAEANAVVNLHKGDAIIDRAADRQGKKFGAAVQSPDDADFGNIKTGTVVLAAHGGRAEVSGTIIGVNLGKRTAAQIVELLTEGSNKSKRLSKDFSGTVWLSGCFTASGGIAPPGVKYDYESFARTVWEALKKKGYKKATVKGQPGIARTDEKGDKSSVTPTGQKDYDKLKKEVAALQASIKNAGTELAKLKAKVGNDDDAEEILRTNPAYVKQIMLLAELSKTAKRLTAEKESHVIKGLVANYGLKSR